MVFMMNKVVEEGTGRRAMLDGIKAAGKTGTTNAYRDAWFVGYTGNFVGGVWFGNDDYTLDQPHDRRLAAGDDLARDHGLCPSGHRAQTASGHRPATAACARSRGRAAKESGAPAAASAADRADPARHRRAGADRAPDGRRQPRACRRAAR